MHVNMQFYLNMHVGCSQHGPFFLMLPRAGRDWNNTEVLAYFDQNSPIRRKIAFAMVSHARLGQESRWTDLDSNVIEMIFKFSLLD